MLDILLLALFVALPVAIWLLSGSLSWTATRLVLAFGLGGNAVQTTIAWGIDWSVRGLQWLSVGLLGVVLALSLLRRRREPWAAPLPQQMVSILLPAVVIGLGLIAMRMAAPDTAGPMSAVGYLINHPMAEDNAKWLHLTSQLASGSPLEFNGYAGGPLLLLMSMVAALISVLSLVLLGGVNEVAVATNILLGTQFLLIALVPFALAPLAERSGRAEEGASSSRLPAPLIWVGILILFTASAVVTSYGHLSFQFVLIVLTLWAAVFLGPMRDRWGRVAMTLAIAASVSVWVPLNVLGLALLVGVVVYGLRRRDWLAVGAVVFTAIAAWDALFSATFYLLGIPLPGTGGGSSGAEGAAGTGGDAGLSLPSPVVASTHLFEAPGATEIAQPLLGVLALAAVLAVVALDPRIKASRTSWTGLLPVLPVAVFAVYVAIISLGDGIVTGAAPHYGGHKLVFALVVMALASTLPLAIALLEPTLAGMSVLRWFAVGGVVVVLTIDTILPRAVSALSPALWPGIDTAAPAYWAPAEVKDQPEQPLSSLPVACLFAPPQSEQPTALPLGQQSYACTRLLFGINGLEGQKGQLASWLSTDWLSNRPNWDSYRGPLEASTQPLRERTVILMTPGYGVAGLDTWGSVLDRNPVTGAASAP